MDDQIDNDTLEAHQEWAAEAHQHMAVMFTHITSMVARRVIKNEDATFLMKHLMEGQNLLENFVPGLDVSDQGKEHV